MHIHAVFAIPTHSKVNIAPSNILAGYTVNPTSPITDVYGLYQYVNTGGV